MTMTVLLYGATGYAGRLIAAEARREWDAPQAPCRMILAARDGDRLKALARECGMDFRVFALDDANAIARGLDGVHVLVNAAGPFAWTAERLANAALEVGCHYVDINDEVDVYRKLDDLNVKARKRNVAMVGSAGHRAGASDLLLNTALRAVKKAGLVGASHGLGTVRIAMTCGAGWSRGSAESVARSLREQVTVVRVGKVVDSKGKNREGPVLWHEPVGKLEHRFDFGSSDAARCAAGPNEYAGSAYTGRGSGPRSDVRTATAVNFVDTLTARLTVIRNQLPVRRIESYVEAGWAVRMAYQAGSFLSPFAALPGARVLTGLAVRFLPEGPAPAELARERQVTLLQIEDAFRTPIIDWRLETPNSIQLTAQMVVAVAASLATRAKSNPLTGWLTPAQALAPLDPTKRHLTGPWRGCRLEKR